MTAIIRRDIIEHFEKLIEECKHCQDHILFCWHRMIYAKSTRGFDDARFMFYWELKILDEEDKEIFVASCEDSKHNISMDGYSRMVADRDSGKFVESVEAMILKLIELRAQCLDLVSKNFPKIVLRSNTILEFLDARMSSPELEYLIMDRDEIDPRWFHCRLWDLDMLTVGLVVDNANL